MEKFKVIDQLTHCHNTDNLSEDDWLNFSHEIDAFNHEDAALDYVRDYDHVSGEEPEERDVVVKCESTGEIKTFYVDFYYDTVYTAKEK
jgi:hypothetical protein